MAYFGNATIVPGSDFAALMSRAPILREQGGNLSQIATQNASISSGLIGKAMEEASDVEQQRIASDAQLQVARMQADATRRANRSTALLGLLPALASGTGLIGGSKRMAGQELAAAFLSSGLANPSSTDLLNGFAANIGALNAVRGAIAPWSAAGREVTRQAIGSVQG